MTAPAQTPGDKPAWCASYTTDTEEEFITPWFEEREDIVDFVGSKSGRIRKLYTRVGGSVLMLTPFGESEPDTMTLPEDIQLEKATGLRSAEDYAQ